MKSRSDGPLTDEDLFIWSRLHGGRDLNGIWQIWRVRAYEGDRRDAELMLILTRTRNGLQRLKETAKMMYDGLTPHEQDVMRRLWGTRRPE